MIWFLLYISIKRRKAPNKSDGYGVECWGGGYSRIAYFWMSISAPRRTVDFHLSIKSSWINDHWLVVRFGVLVKIVDVMMRVVK